MKTALSKILISITVTAAVSAETRSQHLPDSLAAYLEIAARSNPGIQKSLLEYKAALQKVPQAGSLPDLQLRAGAFLKPMELMNGNQVADFEVMQMFPWIGVLRNARDEMSLMANAQYEQFRFTRAQVYYDVQKTWYELFRIRAGISIAEKNISVLKTIERLELVRYKSPPVASMTQQETGIMSSGPAPVGMQGISSGMQGMERNTSGQSAGGKNNVVSSAQSSSMSSSASSTGLPELYRIQIEILGLEDRIESLKNQEKTVTAQMNSLLNRSSRSPVYVDTVICTPSLPVQEDILRDSIMTNNPMLAMLDYEYRSLVAKRKMVTGMSYPMVGIGLSYSLINKSSMSASSMNGTDMVMPMVSVTLPVYRRKYRAMRNEAELLQAASQQGYHETVNMLRTELYSALQMYHDSARRIKLYESQRNLASGSFDQILKNFSASVSSLTDVLRAQQELYDYELKLIETVADSNIAAAWITKLMAAGTR